VIFFFFFFFQWAFSVAGFSCFITETASSIQVPQHRAARGKSLQRC